MKLPTRLRCALVTGLMAALAGCGGERPPAAADDNVLVSGKAVDGPLQGASACYDLDDDGVCGSTEPVSAATGADGGFAIHVPRAHAGRHRTVVDVPATAIDADTGAAVGTAFTLVAPASGLSGDHAVFASPLSTLVQAHMDHTGATLQAAEALVQAQAGLTLSPLADFTAGSSEAHRQAARVAALVQRTALLQWADVATTVGLTDRGGRVLTAADVQAQIQRGLIAALPAVAGAAADPALVGAQGAALQGTLQVLARALHAQLGLTAEAVRAGASAQALDAPAPDPDTTGTLVALRYVDSDNWFMRSHLASAADNVPNGQNYQRYTDVRQQSAPPAGGGNGIVQAWNGRSGSLDRVGDQHWNGSAWVGCALGDRFLSRVRDAAGRSDYVYCDSLELGVSTRRIVDISGLGLLEVVRDQIRTFPGGHSGVSFAAWGPQDLQLLAGASFPADSALLYHSNAITATAPAYDARDSNLVATYSAAVAAGGDARVNPSLACNDPAQYTTTPVATLETLVAGNPGRPCTFNVAGVTPNFSLDPNEWWGNSTIGLGDVAGVNALPAGTGNYYDTTARLRVAFAASGNGATFYNCYRRASDGSPRNCSIIGLGSWSIQTLGDARVLSFSVQPALAQRLGYARVFVERAGKVYYGYKSPAGTTVNSVRLNLPAANAVLAQLGLPPLRPVTPPGAATGARAATLATLRGVWGDASADGTRGLALRVGDNGRYLLAEAGPETQFSREQSGGEIGWLDYDPTTRQLSSLIEVDSNLTTGLSHPRADEGGITITAGAITPDFDAPAPRLQTGATGLLGMWALESATDLSVAHVVFYANGRFMLVDPKGDTTDCVAVGQCPPGVEFGEYTYDAGTGAVRMFNLQYDTNGCAGAFNTCPAAVAGGFVDTESILVITMAADQQSLTFVDDGGAGVTRTLYRIAAQ